MRSRESFWLPCLYSKIQSWSKPFSSWVTWYHQVDSFLLHPFDTTFNKEAVTFKLCYLNSVHQAMLLKLCTCFFKKVFTYMFSSILRKLWKTKHSGHSTSSNKDSSFHCLSKSHFNAIKKGGGEIIYYLTNQYTFIWNRNKKSEKTWLY